MMRCRFLGIGMLPVAALFFGTLLAGCESGPAIRQTTMRVTEVEIRRVSSGTLFETVESRPRTRQRIEPMTLGTGPSSLSRPTRVLREPTKVRVLYRGTYRALVMMRGGERGYVPVTSLEEYLPESAFEASDRPKVAGGKYRDKPSFPIEEIGFDAEMDVFVDQALIDEVNRAAPLPQ